MAGLTELARQSLIALLVGLGGNKVIIEVYCRLSEMPIGGADGRFLWVNLSLRNYKSAVLLALLRRELGGAFIYVSRGA